MKGCVMLSKNLPHVSRMSGFGYYAQAQVILTMERPLPIECNVYLPLMVYLWSVTCPCPRQPWLAHLVRA